VFLSLVSVLTLTGGLLMLTRSAPLAPDASRSLLATNAEGNLEAVFDTKVPVKQGRWKRVFIHHSQSASGNAATLAEASAATAGGTAGPADHFVIGNGDGCGDGEIQLGQRWNQQRPAGAIGGWGAAGRAGAAPTTAKVESDCITICLIGDFDRAFPTPAQMERLGQLVTTLQGRLDIKKDAVWVWETPASPIGIGRYFPQGAFRERLFR
jgi:N-acetylmuramoyl-L-alanine amidase